VSQYGQPYTPDYFVCLGHLGGIDLDDVLNFHINIISGLQSKLYTQQNNKRANEQIRK